MQGPQPNSTEEDDRDAAQPANQAKVVKKLKKVKKATPSAAPAEAEEPSAPPAEPEPPAPAAPPPPPPRTEERIGPAAPKRGTAPSQPAAIRDASGNGSGRIKPPPPPPSVSTVAPFNEPSKAPQPPPEERRAADRTPGSASRISAIDINKLTDELEKDILSSLSSVIGGMLSTPAPPPTAVQEKAKEAATAIDTPRAKPAPAAPPKASGATAHDRQVEGEQRERRVAQRLGREFDKLPINMRNELLKTLARTDDAKVRQDVVIATASHFEKLPPDVRELLRALSVDQDPRVREEVAFELNRSYSKLDQAMRNEIIPNLARDPDVRVRQGIVTVVVARYPDNPPEVRELLKTLASDRSLAVRQRVVQEIQTYADSVPEALRAELDRLMEKAAGESGGE